MLYPSEEESLGKFPHFPRCVIGSHHDDTQENHIIFKLFGPNLNRCFVNDDTLVHEPRRESNANSLLSKDKLLHVYGFFTSRTTVLTQPLYFLDVYM